MSNWIKKLLSVFMSIIMMVQMLPMTANVALAEDGEPVVGMPLDEARKQGLVEDFTASPERREYVAEDVLLELTDLRESEVKHFQLTDGNALAIEYGYPVHYETKAGTYEEIDNRLTLRNPDGSSSDEAPDAVLSRWQAEQKTTEGGKGNQPEDPRTYRNGGGLLETDFAVLSNSDRLVTVLYGGYSLSMTPQQPGDREEFIPAVGQVEESSRATWPEGSLESAIMPKNGMSSLRYENLWEGVDLQYVLTETSLKENIVIHEKQEEYTYSFLLEVDGLKPVMADDGGIDLLNSEGVCVMRIPAGIMCDAAGTYSEAVEYAVQERAGKLVLTVKTDPAWINADDRVFPVTVDPTIEVMWNSGLEISTICSGSPNASHYNVPFPDPHSDHQRSAFGYVGMEPSSTVRKLETLVHVGSLPTLPANSTVVDSQLKLNSPRYIYWNLIPMVLEAYALTENEEQNGSWCKYHCWNDRPPLSDYVLDFSPVRNETEYMYLDVTREAVKWYADPSTNYGICLKAAEEDGMSNGWYGYATIATLDGAFPDIYRPYFIVSYRNTAGVEDYYTYQTQDIGRAGAGYVGDYSGKLTLIRGDVSAASTSNPVSITHVYNSAYCAGEYCEVLSGCSGHYTGMKLGDGWKLGVQQSVVRVDSSYLAYIDGDGSIHYYLGSGNTYQDEDGAGLTITVSGSNYTQSDRYGNSSYFENGVLSYSQSANGNRMTVLQNNNGQITSVTRTNNGGSAETIATFTYDNEGYLAGITDSAGLTTEFSYNSLGQLSTVTFEDDNTASYSYDSAGRLTEAKDDESGYAVDYSYNSNTEKLQGFSEKAGVVTGAAVSVESTRSGLRTYRSCGPDMILGNGDDLLLTCVFDYWGRTINSYTTDATGKTIYGASAAGYSANSGSAKTNNRLLVGSSAGIQSPNMAADPGAEGVTSIGAATTPWFASGSASVETGTKRTGAKSLKLSGNGSIQQTVNGLTADGWYVLSAYVNTSGVSSFGTGGCVYMASGSFSGEAIRWSTAGVGDGWERIYVTAQADTNGSLTLEACADGIQGNVLFDDFQIEESPFGASGSPSTVSLLDNGAMERNAAWSVWVSGHHSVGQVDGLSGKGLQISGIISECIDVYQNVPVWLPGTETYLFSGWAKGASVPIEYPYDEIGQRDFCLAAALIYSDDSLELQAMQYSTQSTDWQYLAFPIVPKQPNKTVKTVMVMTSFGRNPNSVLFDNLSLTREEAQTYTYNSNGDLISVTQPGTATPTYTYSGADLVSQVTRGSGTVNYSYDSHHNVTGVSNDGLSMAVSYDSRGNTTDTTLTGTGTSLQISSSATYDSAGNHLLSQTDARGNTVSYQYENALSQMLGAPTKVTDPLGTVSSTTYDADNARVTQTAILDGNSTEAALSYTYADGRVASMTRTAKLPSGTSFTQTYGMSYNGFGQTTGISVGNISLASYSYAPNGGLLQSMSYGNGDSVEYAYDPLARVSEVYYNESEDPALTYGYASNGALGSLADHENERLYVYSYDGLDRLLSMTESYDGAAVQIFHAGYDTANRVSSTGYRVSPTWNGDLGDPRAYGYTYSSTNGSLSGMTLPGGGAYSYNYDGLRRMNSRSLALNNSPFLTREYDYVPGTGANDTTTLVGTLTNKKGNGTTLDGWTYTYDAAGQITSISDGTDIWSYTYDKQGQLLTETKGTGDDARTWTYSYDTGGNLRSVTTPGISITPIQPPWPRPTFEPMGDGDGEGDEEDDDLAPLEISHTFTYSYGNAQWPDLLTAYNGDPITYDTSGNPTEWYDGAEMSWAHGRQLVSISATNDHAALSFSYDNSGLRLTKTVGTGANAVEHRYTWQGSKLIAEAFEDTELEFFYDESGAPYALLVRDTSTATPTESWYYYVTNLQGDVVMLLDASGNIAAEYSYNAWGEILSSAGTMADVNPIRYRGYYYDAETGLYYLQSRYYDPEIGRFINADILASTGQGILGCNMFAYCTNNPVSYSDPTGAIGGWLKAVAGVVAAVAAAAIVVTIAVAAAPAAICLVATGLELLGASAEVATAVATIGAMTAVSSAAIFTADDAYAGVTGESYLLEHVYHGNTRAYETERFLSTALFYGYMNAAYYGQAAGVCFVAGTLINTEDGLQTIESINTGDLVWAWDENTGEVALKPVVETYINECDELIHLSVKDEEIICTPNHPFYAPQKGWTEAVRLRAGDILVTINGEYVVLEKVQHELLESPVTVYNFQVEDYHTYCVGESGIRVHNAKCGSSTSGKAFASNPKNAREVLSYLKANGFAIVKQEGSHIKLTNGSNTVIVPYHGGKNLPIGTLRSIMKQAGLWG